ncbi:FAD synthase [Candidatus Micrarchaeota archaeon]|nr:FAD synthase [Candidatus Micrarchaeota archaeon]
MIEKEILKTLRMLEIRIGTSFTVEQSGYGKEVIEKLENEGFLEKRETGYVTTQKMREVIRVILTGGVYDILHCGHAFFLQKCKELCDILVVVVAADSTVMKIKNRKPVHGALARAALVGSLKPVDLAVVGDPEDKLKVVKRVNPNAVAFGYDQKNGEVEMCKKLGLEVIRVDKFLEGDMYKTSGIIKSLRSN